MAGRLCRWSAPTRAARWRAVAIVLVLIVPASLAGLCAWLTEPLAERPAPLETAARQPQPPAGTPSVPVAADRAVSRGWPEGRLEGARAKALLLDLLLAVEARLGKIGGYTATFHKQERINGTLGPEQTLAMKVRHQPFAVYFKFLAPREGKEVVYAEGHHDNKVIAHGGGVGRFLVPRLAVPPDHPLALADSRHAVTEAGLSNLTTRLIGYRRMDLDDPEAVTILDRATRSDGRVLLRSVHTHPRRHPERPFARVEVLYDPETRFPVEIRNFDWPETGRPEDDLLLAEHYSYENVNLDAGLSALDFDPKNPDYAFHRY